MISLFAWFSKLKKHANKEIIYYRQNKIHFLLNYEKSGCSSDFAKKHGPAIGSMGWRVENAEFALNEAIRRGAKPADEAVKDLAYPAIYGIGDSLIYFIDQYDDNNSIWDNDFIDLDDPVVAESRSIKSLFHSHLTGEYTPPVKRLWDNDFIDAIRRGAKPADEQLRI